MAVTEHFGRVMASELHIITVGAADGDEAAAHVFLSELESAWSRFIATSDVSRLNLAGGAATHVAPATLTLLATMIEAWRLTDGRYDPTLLPTLVANGYAASKEDPAMRSELPHHQPPVAGTVPDIQLSAANCTAQLPAGMTVDPGGIGKGLAADLTVSWLLARGARGVLVGIGGDVSCAGEPPEATGWVVEIERPDPADAPLCAMALSGGGVATSSTRSRRWVHDGVQRHHLIDPLTGAQSGSDLATVTVIAATGWEAEAHATAALLAGSGGVLQYLVGHGLSGLAVDLHGAVTATDDIRQLELLPR